MPLRLAIACAAACGLALFGPFVQSAQAPSPMWAVEPADFGPDQPPIGRSAFDALVARTSDGAERLVVPFPFTELVKLIESKTQALATVFNFDSTGVHKVLIPLGRSLQRRAARPDYFAFPRIVLGVTGAESPSETDFPLLRDRLFIGYQEKAESLEVISYNELAGRFEFELVSNYKAGATPEVTLARRSFCLKCHQNHAPIFSQREWGETNANPSIASRIVAARAGQGPGRGEASAVAGSFHGVPLEVPIAAPAEIDASARRANNFQLTQSLWRTACELGDPLKSRACRLAAIKATFEYRLSGDFAFADSERFRQDYVAAAKARSAGSAWWAPQFHISFRDPLRQSDPEEILPDDEPMNPRGPEPGLVALDDETLGDLARDLGMFFSDADIARLDTALGRTPQMPTVDLTATCAWAPRRRGTQALPGQWMVDCTGSGLAIQSRIAVRAAQLGAEGPATGSTERFERAPVAGCSNCGRIENLEFRGTVAPINAGGWRASLEPRSAARELSARFANADRVVSIEIRAEAGQDPAAGGTVTVTARIARESVATEAMLVRAMAPLADDAFTTGAFSRSRILTALRQLARAPGEDSKVEAGANGPRPQEPVAPPSSELPPPLQAAMRRCAGCHSNGIGFPTEFTDGNIAMNVDICAERILFRMEQFRKPPGQRRPSAMPPLISLQDGLGPSRRPHLPIDPGTEQDWLASEDYRLLRDYVSAIVEKRHGNVQTVLQRPWPQGPCAGNGAD